MKQEEFIGHLKKESSKRSFINSMATGTNDFFFWRPNNYRRQLVIKETSNSIGKSAIAKKLGGKVANHSKLLFLKNYSSNITLQLGKNKLEAFWSQNVIGGVKEVYEVPFGSFDSFLDAKKKDIEKALDKALFDFCKRFNYSSIGLPVWSRYEDFIRGESFVDSIPSEVIIHDPFFKKVYADGIEAIGGLGDMPTERIRLYIHNRMKEAKQEFNKFLVNAIDEALLLPFDKQVEFVEGLNKILDKYNS